MRRPALGRSSDKLKNLALSTPLKILIVDDHSLVREGLKAILSLSDLSASFVEASDAISGQAQLKQHPDIALMLLDIQMPGCNGLEFLETVIKQRPELPVIMLSGEHDSPTVTHALNAGASGFLPKNSLNQVLVSAVNLVLAGGIYIPPEALRTTKPEPSKPSKPVDPAEAFEALGLTVRQIDVFRLLVQGHSNKQICRQMDVAEATVKIHVRAILRALTVTSRSEAIAKATQLGLRVPEAAESPLPKR